MRHPQISLDELVSEWGDAGKHLTPLHKGASSPRCPLALSTIASFLLGITHYHLEISEQICLSPLVTYILCSPKQQYPNKLML